MTYKTIMGHVPYVHMLENPGKIEVGLWETRRRFPKTPFLDLLAGAALYPFGLLSNTAGGADSKGDEKNHAR